MAGNVPRRSRLLLAGDFGHPDFDRLRRWLSAHCDVQQQSTPTGIRSGSSHQLSLLCQSRPGQFSQADVEALYRSAPLAGLLAILGSWCEGEARSGRAWQGIERVFWYEAIGRVQRLLVEPQGFVTRTESPPERIVRQTRDLQDLEGQTVLVVSRHGEYEPLADLCRCLKANPYWYSGGEPWPDLDPALVLTAADDLAGLASTYTITSLRRAWPKARIAALLNFPRRDEIASLEAAGCDFVLGKPVLIGNLAAVLGSQALVS